jgi:MYXO-CTERM domain-containing protein
MLLRPASLLTLSLPLLPLVTLPGSARAAPASCAPSRLLIVLDKSSSMNGAAGTVTKWTAARGAIDQVTDAYDSSIQLGLATFPYPDTCGPGRIVVAPSLGQGDAIHAAMMSPPPEWGFYTPLGETLLALAEQPALTTAASATHVVVITDGFQWCSPYDPATRSLPLDGVEALTAEGVTTFVVGFGAGVDVETLDQMAVAAGTARPGCDPSSEAASARCYYQADDANALLSALMDIAAVTAAETCDDQDNDCDGMIDEDACPTTCSDGGVTAAGDAGVDMPLGEPAGGCGCSTGAGADPYAGVGFAAALLAVLGAISRRRPAKAQDRRPVRRLPADPARR